MVYLWLKAFHVVAAIAWIGGILASAVVLMAATHNGLQRQSDCPSTFITLIRRWDQRVTSVAMLLTWALGLALALLGGWFPDVWLIAKLGVVLLLSALHGWLSGRLRRLHQQNPAQTAPGLQYVPFGIILAVAVVAILVVTKPV